ncbi:MAG TPA: RluA family pseudouridine synthase [Casimicrobiaceae bacterium]|nr:RluA family pseudouridine synthase [Casimicrobiaceae bacterium]
MNELSKEAATRLTVGEEAVGQRIDNYLLRLMKGVPKSHVYRILRSGEVRINGRRTGPDSRLVAGDEVRVPPIRIADKVQPTRGRVPAPPPSLYEDDHLLAVDKPSGLAVHGGSGIAFGLIETLRATRPANAFLELVHRLDRETSGVLLVAKKRSALTRLHEMLRTGEIDKRYLVLVRGRWRDEKRTVEVALHRFSTRAGERKVRVDAEIGRDAKTTFHRVRVWRDHEPPLSLLEAELLTGRTHQIRVTLTHLGFPLAADDKYGDFAWNRELARQGLKRMFLHAKRLALMHPASGEPLVLESPLPVDLQRFVARLDEPADGER